MSPLAPVLFIVFNRPDTTARVFETIREAKPGRLFVAADGPRSEEERRQTEKTREITESIDWDCKVERLYSPNNLGCRLGVTSAINWAFEYTDRLIILEDDCLPAVSFFRFCTELLSRYEDDHQVSAVTGANLFGDKYAGNASYFFSKVGGIWGWATWRRAWDLYEANIYERLNSKVLKDLRAYLESDRLFDFYLSHLTLVSKGQLDTWDFQWIVSQILNKKLSILPARNMVSNIGFGPEATHTKSSGIVDQLLAESYDIWDLSHPENSNYPNEKYLADFEKLVVPSVRVKNLLLRKIKRVAIEVLSKSSKFHC